MAKNIYNFDKKGFIIGFGEHSFLKNPTFGTTKLKPLANESTLQGGLSPVITTMITPFVVELSSSASQGRGHVARTTDTKTTTTNNTAHLRRWSLALLSTNWFY